MPKQRGSIWHQRNRRKEEEQNKKQQQQQSQQPRAEPEPQQIEVLKLYAFCTFRLKPEKRYDVYKARSWRLWYHLDVRTQAELISLCREELSGDSSGSWPRVLECTSRVGSAEIDRFVTFPDIELGLAPHGMYPATIDVMTDLRGDDKPPRHRFAGCCKSSSAPRLDPRAEEARKRLRRLLHGIEIVDENTGGEPKTGETPHERTCTASQNSEGRALGPPSAKVVATQQRKEQTSQPNKNSAVGHRKPAVLFSNRNKVKEKANRPTSKSGVACVVLKDHSSHHEKRSGDSVPIAKVSKETAVAQPSESEKHEEDRETAPKSQALRQSLSKEEGHKQ